MYNFRSNPVPRSNRIQSLREKIARVEDQLNKARAELRAEAKRAGMAAGGLFGETAFVPRSFAERLAKRARSEGADDGRWEMVPLVQAALDPSKSPFAHLREIDFRAGLPGAGSQTRNSQGSATSAKKILAAVELQERGGRPAPAPTGLAARIIAADKKRRNAEN